MNMEIMSLFLRLKEGDANDMVTEEKKKIISSIYCEGERLLKKRTVFYFAHAHCCSKFTMRHKAAVATVVEFIAKGKKIIRESRKKLNG
jgi:hypothetical protein